MSILISEINNIYSKELKDTKLEVSELLIKISEYLSKESAALL